jgi:hypothetical protein
VLVVTCALAPGLTTPPGRRMQVIRTPQTLRINKAIEAVHFSPIILAPPNVLGIRVEHCGAVATTLRKLGPEAAS